MDQLEILRGPELTQKDGNALDGANIIRSRDPEYFKEYRIRFGAGSPDGHDASQSSNTVLVQDRAAFRISAQALREDRFVSNPRFGIGDISDADFSVRRTKL